MPVRLTFCIACLVAVLTLPAAAQETDSTLVQRFRLADAYLRAGQFDRAIRLLEDLHAASPDSYAFYEKLKLAYESVKRYDEAIALVEGQMAGNASPHLLSEKASLLYLKGDEPGAFATWDEAIALDPQNANTYRIVYQSLSGQRLFDRAAGVLVQGREALKDKSLFQRDLAYLYSLNGKHEEAIEEYLALLEDSEQQLSFVRSRLTRFMEQEGALDKSIDATRRAVRRNPYNRAYRELLAWLYVENEDFAEALDVNRAIDRLEKTNGAVLFAFAQTAADAGAYDVALEAYQEILDRYPESPTAPEALFGLGQMQEQRGDKTGERATDAQGERIEAPHYEQALATYRTFLQTYPAHPYYPEALRRIGRLQLDVFVDLGQAESTLREVVARYPRSPAAEQAEYDLGRVALLRGDLDDARLAFGRLEERLRLGELAERSRFELALLHFYEGEFEAAQTLADVMNTNTSTDVANDAIELKVLLIENKGPDSLSTPLQRYASARLLLRQHRPTQAIETLDGLLAEFGTHPLADDARFLRAEALRDAGRTDDALAAFGELPLLHPRSYLADRSLFSAAEIREDRNATDEAIKLYTRILTEYPGSLLTQEARTRIRLLRGDTL